MKIFLLVYAFVARFKITLGQDDTGGSTDGKDEAPTKIGVGGGSSAKKAIRRGKGGRKVTKSTVQ